jgi:hypothetical protein
MGTELVLETSEHFSVLTLLLAREAFIEFSCRENIKTYNVTGIPLLLVHLVHPSVTSSVLGSAIFLGGLLSNTLI